MQIAHLILNSNSYFFSGISIVGGRIEINDKLGGHLSDSTTVSGIFIKSVLPDSPAGKSGMINMGDRIISVYTSRIADKIIVL